jgi:hypothetical protein
MGMCVICLNKNVICAVVYISWVLKIIYGVEKIQRKDVFQRLLDQQTSLRNKMNDANAAWYYCSYYSAMLGLSFFFGVNPKVMMGSIMEYAFVIFFSFST